MYAEDLSSLRYVDQGNIIRPPDAWPKSGWPPIRENREIREKSGNFFSKNKIREKSGNFKIWGKIREKSGNLISVNQGNQGKIREIFWYFYSHVSQDLIYDNYCRAVPKRSLGQRFDLKIGRATSDFYQDACDFFMPNYAWLHLSTRYSFLCQNG